MNLDARSTRCRGSVTPRRPRTDDAGEGTEVPLRTADDGRSGHPVSERSTSLFRLAEQQSLCFIRGCLGVRIQQKRHERPATSPRGTHGGASLRRKEKNSIDDDDDDDQNNSKINAWCAAKSAPSPS